ncbi:MAG: universal stress protein [Balneolaceae bacterium]|nr:universal stress protein [Balneolaceae bacterium]
MVEENEKTILVREILVAVDTSKHSQAALEAAALLARILEAKIQGFFVYDEIWNRVSRLPSISVVNSLTGQISPFEDQTMENQVSVLENRLRKKLENISRRHKITYSWNSTRGKVEEEILEAAKNSDLITIGLKGASARRKVLGSSARRIIQQADKPILILKEGLHLGRKITAVYDGSEESYRAVQAALNIAERNESTITILMVNNNSELHSERNKEIEKLLRNSPVYAKVELLDQPNASRFLNSVNQQKSGLLILSKDQPLLRRSLQVISKSTVRF